MAEHRGRSEKLGATISDRETKGLEAEGPSNPRVGNRFQGGGHHVGLGGKGILAGPLVLETGEQTTSRRLRGGGTEGISSQGTAPSVLR